MKHGVHKLPVDSPKLRKADAQKPSTGDYNRPMKLGLRGRGHKLDHIRGSTKDKGLHKGDTAGVLGKVKKQYRRAAKFDPTPERTGSISQSRMLRKGI